MPISELSSAVHPRGAQRLITEGEGILDLNYLFHRQQVERSMAAAAASDEAREIHELLAKQYEVEIERLTSEGFTFHSGSEARA